MGLAIALHVLSAVIWVGPFRRLKQAVANQDPQEGGRRVGQIRKLVGINLILGLITVVIGAGGRYL